MGGIASVVGLIVGNIRGLAIPIWVWVVIGLPGLLIAQFMAFHNLKLQRDKLESQLDDKYRRHLIKDTLGRFLSEGLQLQKQCADENKDPPNKEAYDWAARVEEYLSGQLGCSYVSRFRSSAGLPMVAASIFSIPHCNLWGGIHTRLSRLGEFIREIPD